YEDLEAVTRELGTLAFTQPDPKQQKDWQRQLADLTDKKERLEIELAQRSVAFQKQRQRAQLTAKDLQGVLPVGVALVDFLEYTDAWPSATDKGKIDRQRKVIAFVTRAGQALQLVDLGSAAKLNEAIDQWRSSIKQSVPP